MKLKQESFSLGAPLTQSQKLCAIAWAAHQLGTSYGKLAMTLSEDERDKIYTDYRNMELKRQEEEHERLEIAKKQRCDKRQNKSTISK